MVARSPGLVNRHAQVGKNKCHIVDTFWQTETGGHVMLPLAGVTPTKPGSCSFPFFGIEVKNSRRFFPMTCFP